MLIDMHAHSSGISRCCRVTCEEAIRQTLDAGMDGIVLTNHYQKKYLSDCDAATFAARYVEEFQRAREYGERVGCRVYFGIEVTMERHEGAHLVIYGVDERFVMENPTMFELSQEQLHGLVRAAGGVLIQAHPYRQKKHLLDVRFLDGVEVNCHPLYESSEFEAMLEIAKGNALLLTCGGDFHADTYRPKCGVYLPDALSDGVSLGRYLLSAEELRLCVHEKRTGESFDFLYPCPKR